MELNFDNVSKQYGSLYALKDFSVTLTNGVYGLLGPNGAGKTTLISILVGILKANQGAVLLNGKDITLLGSRYFDNIGYLPQYPRFYSNFRIDEFLKYMCVLKNIPKGQINPRIGEVLELVNLSHCDKKKIGTLSGGMRQRVGVAQAILNKPKILVLDEPTAGLDPRERIRFRNLISRISKDKIVLLATHIVQDVEYIANEIIILNHGRLELSGTPQELINNISKKVWRVLVSEDEMEALIRQFQVANVKHMGNQYQLRIVSDNKPAINANCIEPILEDVFLSIVSDEVGERSRNVRISSI
jgi:ABC-2 type transport system ATP-binding protein